MKYTLLLFSFILCTLTVSAQENTSTNTKTKAEQKNTKHAACNTTHADAKTICYSETSKVAYYEALIAKNNFNIYLINSNYSTKKKNKKTLTPEEKEEDRAEEILYANW